MKSKWSMVVSTIALLGACGGLDPEQTDSGAPQTGEVQQSFHRSGKPTVIKIGALDDPGTTSLYGAAIRLAESQMNRALRRARSDVRFEIAFGDSQGNTPPVALSETLRLLNEENVLAMVSDSSGDTIQVNRLNYDPMSAAPYQFPVICYQCSNGSINDPAAVNADPITQAALRDEDNWLRRVFYIANYEAAVLDQIIANLGDRNGDGNLKLSIYADGGHLSLANAIAPTLANFYTDPSSVEIVVLSDLSNLDAEWALVTDTFNESTGIADGEPDYVVLGMLPVSVTAAVLAYRNAGYTLPVISNNSFRRNYILGEIGAGANGLQGSSVALANSSPSGQLFIDAFTEANAGQGPEQTSSGAYDATVALMLASLVAADAVGASNVTPDDIQAALDHINEPNGRVVRPSVKSFTKAARRIARGKPINYDGAYDAVDWDAVGNIFPALVHWVVQDEQFVEVGAYNCNPENPLCPAAP